MRIQRTLILLLVVVVVGIGPLGGHMVRADDSTFQALWVFSDEVTDRKARRTLVQRSAATGVDALYLSVYQSTFNSSGRLMYEDSNIADLIRRAHRKGIEVWAAYGAPDWPAIGCYPALFPLQRMTEVIGYNDANPSAEFDGVALDVEPPEPQTEADFVALLTLYQCILETLEPEGLKLAVAIRFFWDTKVWFGQRQEPWPAHQHIIDLDLDNVVVMGYRDSAGTACPYDGIICLDQDEIAYAHSLGKDDLILVGLETSNCAPGCGLEKVTFFEEGQRALNREARRVARHFGGGFGGFAIHRYKDSYLGRLRGWPPANPRFP